MYLKMRRHQQTFHTVSHTASCDVWCHDLTVGVMVVKDAAGPT